MEPELKTACLKDGTEVVLRPMVENDLEKSLSFFQNLPESDRQYLRYDVTDFETLKKRIEDTDAEERYRIVVELGGIIIGDGVLIQPRHGWKRHTGEVRCIVAHKYQGLGLGWLMINDLFQAATNRGVEIIIGQIPVEQTHISSMMERLGFTPQCVRPNQQRTLHGDLSDVVIVTANIASAWRRMEDLMAGMDGLGRERHPRKKRSQS
jgi:acetyltransferase